MTVEPSSSEEPIDWIRITLIDGVRFTMRDAVVTDDEISGSSNGREFSISRKTIETFEISKTIEAVPNRDGPPTVGDWVQITAPELDINLEKGTLMSLSTESIVVDTLDIPLNSVTQFYVYRGKKGNAGTGAIAGLTVGVIVGVGLGYVGSQVSETDDSPVPVMLVGAGVVGIAGLLVGAMFGALVKTDHWERVYLNRLSLMPTGNGRLSVNVAIRF